ncbi:MAG: DUF6176 family protein [Arenicellales bacterium]
MKQWMPGATRYKKQKKEALATLIDGGVKVESWCAIKIDGQNYLLRYMRALSLDQAWKVASNSQHEIEAYHFETMAAVTADDGNIEAKPVLDMIPDENLF